MCLQVSGLGSWVDDTLLSFLEVKGLSVFVFFFFFVGGSLNS